MRLGRILMMAACGLFAGALSAQVGVYVLATGQHMTGIHWDSSSVSDTTGANVVADGPYKGKFSPLGYTLGSYYDFHSFGRVRLGADARFMSTSAQKGTLANSVYTSGPLAGQDLDGPRGPEARIYSGLGGVRASMDFKYHSLILKPYLQASAGLTRTNYGVLFPGSNGGTGRLNNLGATAFAGVDVALAPIMSLRIEGGTGMVHGGPATATYPLQSFSLGFVFHTRKVDSQ